jgi:hypothetical protein
MQKTFRDSVYALCLEKVVLAECPANVYLHLRRSTADLSLWSAEHFTGVTDFTETDYTAWDSSIDGPFITFDCWLLTQIGCPEEYVSLYRTEATTTRYFGGNLRLMQHSGNRYTFLLNTLRNLALTNCTYHGLRHTAQAYGGDDSLLAGLPAVSRSFRPEAWLMAPKVNRTSTGHLFGHLISNGVLTYDYSYMANRLEVAIVERPYDTDFFRSFCDQMSALPYRGSPEYARVYDMLVSHLRICRLVVPGFTPSSTFPLSFSPNSIYTNGVLAKSHLKGWVH